MARKALMKLRVRLPTSHPTFRPLENRVFLAEETVRILRPRPEWKVKSNVVVMRIPVKMGKIDLKNYLQRIYDLSVDNIDLWVKPRRIIELHGGRQKRLPFIKQAFVTLTPPQTFTFPTDIFSDGAGRPPAAPAAPAAPAGGSNAAAALPSGEAAPAAATAVASSKEAPGVKGMPSMFERLKFWK